MTRQAAWLTVPQILTELDIPRRTWQRWRALGKTPACSRFPNGTLRVKRCDYETWLDSMAESSPAGGCR
ncbi:hypothetical protein Acor_83320 [Acrocarpospora corrugata]|uniref:Helix-turn-helix domain-containing protein n=1 Tax=Acrocarpospora corrugata TaxID=35763 RepID=A0A5M3WGM8_9ACTN|nr:hypothetical protein Acor_83320 [Acrocarpospora corrugata]